MIAQGDRFWHIWCYIIKDTNNHQLFGYGFAAESYLPPPEKEENVPFHYEDCGENFIIEAWHNVYGTQQFDNFSQNICEGQIDFNSIGIDKIPAVTVKANRQILQDALEKTVIPTKIFYTLPNIEKLPKNVLKHILTYLKSETGQDFSKGYAARFGCFEIFSMPLWAEDQETPFELIFTEPENGWSNFSKRNKFEIHRRPDFALKKHFAAISFRSGDDVIYKKLLTLSPDKEIVGPIETPEHFDGYDFNLFEDDGTVIHYRSTPLLNAINFGSNVIEAQINLKNDSLAKSVIGAGEQKRSEKISNVIPYTQLKSTIGFQNKKGREQVKKFALKMKELVSIIFDKPSDDRWFSKGPCGAVDAVLHIKALTNRAREAIILDPFFDQYALINLVTKIEKKNLKLTVLTNLRKIDPSTGEQVNNESISPAEKIKQALDNNQMLIHCQFRLQNLVLKNSQDKQAFHDRYLCVYPDEENRPVKIYLLSNSINNMAGNYPFCISRLSHDVAEEIKNYIQTLCSNSDAETKLISDLDWNNYDN